MVDALLDFAADIARWLHVLAAVAWMGFGLWLRRLAFRARPLIGPQAELEVWDTHSLGFWRTAKVAAPTASELEGLVWSFNQIRWLFMTGLVLLGLIYYRQPQVYLIDPGVLSMSGRAAVAFSLLGLLGAPLINEAINRIPLRYRRTYILSCAIHVLAWVYAYASLFSQQGAMIQVGAMLGVTITANILWYLHPATREAVDALIRGERPDPVKKQLWDRRNYHSFLLPAVVFLMLSSHMGAIVRANGHAFLTIATVLVLSVISRRILEATHKNGGVMPARFRWITAGAVLTLGLGVGWLASARHGFDRVRVEARAHSAATDKRPLHAEEIVLRRYAACHAAQPSFPGMASPPRGIVFTPDNLPRYAGQIAIAVGSERMPPGNATDMLPSERRALTEWAIRHGQ
ncbi:urate hydroxylase PuuD [Lysobacter antibioticus]|uniref:urate hydroxylase PuuD n=1 Tax=Lysobacter antibioticus TaxID=84531 RepID=UPI0004D003E0|nr:urate hydroxylase PuuD [Lysobacter antibioticus]